MSDIAKTIYQQLGGNRFKMMTGARDFIAGEDSLAFKLPRGFATNKITHIKIVLTVNDTYNMFFTRYISSGKRMGEHEGIRQDENLYADMLQSIFTEATGLDTKL